jgi:hypothetical protein
MAKSKSAVLEAEREPKADPSCCGNCRHWLPGMSVTNGVQHGIKAFGQCALSGKSLSAPLVTLDKALCSAWVGF